MPLRVATYSVQTELELEGSPGSIPADSLFSVEIRPQQRSEGDGAIGQPKRVLIFTFSFCQLG
jgi:hypothetical protein